MDYAVLTFQPQNRINDMILHIPHSGVNTLGRNIESSDIDALTDWSTQLLFHHEGADLMVQDVSRFVCDVERFPDDIEPLYKDGHGICYTKGANDNPIEVVDKDWIIENIYNKWHNELNKLVAKALCYFPIVVVVDCHSFTGDNNSPDIRIGTTNQTPPELVCDVVGVLLDSNYTIGINVPYSGSIIPTQYINNIAVMSIMIEVNKRLYMKSNNDFISTKCILSKVLDVIYQYEQSNGM